MRSRPVVVLIIGHGRTGSTLLDRILSQACGALSGGEVHRMWTWSIQEDWKCGCGVKFSKCNVWSEVLGRVFEKNIIEKSEMDEIWREVARPGHIPYLYLPKLRSKRFKMVLKKYKKVLFDLYKSMSKISSSGIVLDSSLSPIHGRILQEMEKIDLRIVHMVRNPCGVAFSNLKRKKNPGRTDKNNMDRKNPIRTSLSWNLYNVLCEIITGSEKKTAKVYYERLAKKPKLTISRTMKKLELEYYRNKVFTENNRVRLEENHIPLGNPMRFKRGEIEIFYDSEWKEGLSYLDQKAVNFLCYPLIYLYNL
jgi:hypothetical protein